MPWQPLFLTATGVARLAFEELLMDGSVYAGKRGI